MLIEHPELFRQLEARGATQSAANFGASARGCVASEIRGGIGLVSEAAKRRASSPIPVQSSSTKPVAAKLTDFSSAGHPSDSRQAVSKGPALPTCPPSHRQAEGRVNIGVA